MPKRPVLAYCLLAGAVVVLGWQVWRLSRLAAALRGVPCALDGDGA